MSFENYYVSLKVRRSLVKKRDVSSDVLCQAYIVVLEVSEIILVKQLLFSLTFFAMMKFAK